ncbi:DUF429 domain-containing protein [Serinicoccus kebangsaanensis]|uniref:DUF429 domain-containing protein n=1 Tax=Serinicoccus kebangsaanensis TaxID=2602069 RepID=UPI00124C9CBA|nr:DUF429 domain-containing protein [Serinicoccus kebangsaanensis]
MPDMFVGIDLAWNDRARTGLAAVDADGRLVGSATFRSDEEIDAWLRAYPGPEVVAVDAPLIVTNPTGQRPCERLVTSAYGRYDAGCHASNTSKAYMDPPRAARLAGRHGWVTDPSASGPGVCLEVYPHPAMVGLFGLGRILPYKGKRGRSVEARRTATVDLLDRIDGLSDLDVSGSDRWREIRYAVEHASRPMHLEHVEDEIDAVFCAHLAWLWRHSPGALRVYGDVGTGYIVAPPAPTHETTPRAAHSGEIRRKASSPTCSA